jgi:GGDEF domain-containing protein
LPSTTIAAERESEAWWGRRSLQEVVYLTRHDELTGLLNRREFDTRAAKAPAARGLTAVMLVGPE